MESNRVRPEKITPGVIITYKLRRDQRPVHPEKEWHGKTVMRMTPEVKDDLCFCLIVHDQANDPVCTSPARS